MVQLAMENEIKEYTVTIYTENQIGLLSQIQQLSISRQTAAF